MRSVTIQYFLSLSIIQLLIAFYTQTYVLTDELLSFLIGIQMTQSQLEEYFEMLRKWQWVSYFFIPLAMLLRISFTWICLKAGSFITEKFTDAAFWKICIQAEIVFAVGAVVGLVYTEFFVNVETLEQLAVNPFSLHVFTADRMPKWSSYFFNTLNIFELGYVFVLAHLIAEEWLFLDLQQ